MKNQSAELGKWGEDLAVKLLVSKGYAIRETNWKLPPLEIDVVAMKGTRIVFVEVKTRSNGEYDPVTAINRKKQANMIKAANTYLLSNELPNDVQFDVVLIVGTPDTGFSIDHIEDAFYPPLKKY
ncbi:MAG: YraN family protein [Muribaculaceae bacterium]|nr:YraN family protein [Muribaculaceae bacterium]